MTVLAHLLMGITPAVPAGVSYLLDGFSAAPPVLSASFRRLYADYVGQSCRVRRSVDNAESDFGFIGAELDTAAVLDFCGSGDGAVTTIYDKAVGGVRHFTRTTAAAQPLIVQAGALVEINGFAAHYSPASTYYLQLTSDLRPGVVQGVDAASVLASFVPHGANTTGSTLYVESSVSGQARVTLGDADGAALARGRPLDSGGYLDAVGGSVAADEPVCLFGDFQFAAGYHGVYVDGVLEGSTTYAGTPASSVMSNRIWIPRYRVCTVGDVLLWNETLGAADLAALHADQLARMGMS